MLGKYHVMSNNLHFYTGVYPNGEAIWNNLVEGPDYHYDTFPILDHASEYEAFFHECSLFCDGDTDRVTAPWLKYVAKPMRDAYLAKTQPARFAHCGLIGDHGWKVAAVEFLERAYEKKDSAG